MQEQRARTLTPAPFRVLSTPPPLTPPEGHALESGGEEQALEKLSASQMFQPLPGFIENENGVGDLHKRDVRGGALN